MTKPTYPETGTILATCFAESGDHEISAAISMTESMWKRVIDAADDSRLPFFAPRPELPLRDRISEFLVYQTQVWAAETEPLRWWDSDPDDGSDEEWPF